MSVEQLELAEIQGLIVSGYAERPCAKYVLFAIDDVARAQSWIGRIVDRLQYGEFIATPKGEPPYLNDVCLNLALTHEGFAQLGLAQDTLLGFSGSFRGGMAAPHRSRQLGDDGPSAPARWHWGGPSQPVHGMLLVYAGRDDGDPEEDQRCSEEIAREVSPAHGLRVLAVRDTTPIKQKNRAEHFGFADGIANPTLVGLDPLRRKHDVIPNGEVVLGYLNGYDKYGLSPLVDEREPFAALLPTSKQAAGRRDFGRNGSYLVFRELAQDVAGFWRFVEQAAKQLPGDRSAVWLASRMVGRWPSGAPVTMHPDRDPQVESAEDRFGYHDHADFFGTSCPIGSHIRRTNPRETLLPMPHDPPLAEDIRDRKLAEQRARMANRHRLLRRGRLYGPRVAESFDVEHLKQADDSERGLHFLCFVANLRRQFEFVQGTWVVNPNFAGLSRDPDPLLGANRSYPFEANSFIVPGCPVHSVDGVPRVVETRGGAYLFMPSRSALRYLAALGRSAELAPAGEPVDGCERALADIEKHKVERDFAARASPKRALRAFHSKCHGIVQATLRVDPALPAPFRTPLFVPGASYPAWARFSSGDFGLHPDTRRDVHGLAIKVMNVLGERVSDYESDTQDFVLIDAPRLMVASPEEALALERAVAKGKLALALHLLKNPQIVRRLAQMTSTPNHPLARSYHSVTPFGYGEGRAVRWVVRLQRGTSLVEVAPGRDHLRDALRAQLQRGPVTLELCIQNRGTRPLSLDDASATWPVSDERVATLTLEPQGFDSAAQEALGDGLSFNPWNALRAHRPLGRINRVRRLYRELYELRMRLNGTAPVVPRPK